MNNYKIALVLTLLLFASSGVQAERGAPKLPDFPFTPIPQTPYPGPTGEGDGPRMPILKPNLVPKSPYENCMDRCKSDHSNCLEFGIPAGGGFPLIPIDDSHHPKPVFAMSKGDPDDPFGGEGEIIEPSDDFIPDELPMDDWPACDEIYESCQDSCMQHIM